jgi:hypothetical protein
MVCEEPFEGAPLVGARIEDVEQLEQHEGGESHRLRIGPGPSIRPPGSDASITMSVPAAITAPTKKMPAHMRRVITPSPRGRGGSGDRVGGGSVLSKTR